MTPEQRTIEQRVCSKCGNVIPGIDLACRACIARRARDELMQQQERHVGEVLTGRRLLRLARTARSSRLHVAIFGNPLDSYCTQPLIEVAKRTELAYTKRVREDMCVECLRVFDQIAERVSEREL